METGAELIAAERKRQLEQEGWTAEHDRQHERCELAVAAACYALHGTDVGACTEAYACPIFHDAWPWGKEEDKRNKHGWQRRLVIAGALIAAELDRLKAEDESCCSIQSIG